MTRRDVLRLSAVSAISGGLRPPLASADDPPKAKSPDEMIHAYLAEQVKRIAPRFMDGAKTKDEWEKVRPRLKREFLDMLGLDPLPEKTPLNATVTGTIERGGVVIEKVHFQSRPGLYVTANLYLPANGRRKPAGAAPKHPGILYVCGHSNRGRDGNKTAFADHGLWFASNGYVCLVVDTLQLGEVAGVHHGTYNLERFWWQDRGYTPAGVECWNGVRGIDYLVSRPEVDPERIGVTGISGGGATTCWVAAADDRVKVAVPVSGMSDLECYVTDRVVNGHCDCMFPVNTYQWNLQTILALHAPKPLLFANSDDDKIFPMSGNRRIAELMRKCYAMFGVKDNFDDYVSKGGHDYRPDLRLAVFGFFNKFMFGSAAGIKDADFPKIEGKDLRVFPTDGNLPKDSINAKADETFVPVAKVKLPADVKEFAAWKADTLKQLREKCFRPWPEHAKDAGWHGDWVGDERGYQTEPGMVVRLRQLKKVEGKPDRTLIVLNADEEPLAADKLWADRTANDFITEAVAARGVGPLKWSRKNPPNTVERSLVLVAQTADAGRVQDVVAVLSFHYGVSGRTGRHLVRLVGSGAAGIISAYAALLWPHVREVIIVGPPTSHRDGPHFLNVLRVLDIPEALGLLAPDVKLTLVGKNAKDKAFDRTAAIYKAAGAADKFKRE